jgi:L-threonylcarbamoyladenylate synthase
MARRLVVDPQCPAPTVLAEALAVLRGGGVVAYPTDTVYGLAVDAMRPDAIARLYTVKRRPASKALPVIRVVPQ